jgi:hypothetical protein
MGVRGTYSSSTGMGGGVRVSDRGEVNSPAIQRAV